jgi:uncharacterized protein
VPFAPATYPQDQSPDDALSLAFESDPLPADIDLLGWQMLRLELSASAPVAQLAARLCEVTPDGRSWLVSYGVRNLAHRESHASPSPLVPGATYEIALPLGLTGRRLRAGSRIRLALSEGLWPLLWPSPEPVEITVRLAAASLELPVRTEAAEAPAFPIPVVESRTESGRGDPEVERRRAADGEIAFVERWPLAESLIADTGTLVERSGPNVELSMLEGAPESCRWRASQTIRYARGDWDCALEAEIEITADARAFHVRERLVARLRGEEIFERTHETDAPRDLM